MDEADRSLLCWCLATFDAAAVVVVSLLAFHLNGAIGDLLGGLDTLAGAVLFLALWGATWWANAHSLRRIGLDGTLDPPSATDALRAAVVAGGGAGAAFASLLLVAVTVPDLDLSSLAAVSPLLAVVLLVAVAVGTLVGAALALLNLLLVAAARALVRTEG